MSLNYNLKGVANYKELLDKNGSPDVMLKSLIFATMPLGMGAIKNDEDAIEFFGRLSFYEKAFGAFRVAGEADGFKPVYFTLDEVKRCIGLSTNVFPKETAKKFAARIFESFARENAYAARRAAEKAEEVKAA